MRNYIIEGASGVEAEADTERAAIRGARAFVEDDGEAYALVMDERRVVIGKAEMDERGRYIYRTTQGRNRS